MTCRTFRTFRNRKVTGCAYVLPVMPTEKRAVPVLRKIRFSKDLMLSICLELSVILAGVIAVVAVTSR